MMDVKNYFVLGFVFDHGGWDTLLIKKTHPESMAGKLNGLGGRCKDGEPGPVAMRREFMEEAGLMLDEWELFAILRYPATESAVLCYRAFVEPLILGLAKSQTEEQVAGYDVANLLYRGGLRPALVDDVEWLIPLALSNFILVADVTLNSQVERCKVPALIAELERKNG